MGLSLAGVNVAVTNPMFENVSPTRDGSRWFGFLSPVALFLSAYSFLLADSGGGRPHFVPEIFFSALAATSLVLFTSFTRGVRRSKTRLVSGLICVALLGSSLLLMRQIRRPSGGELRAIGDSHTVLSAQLTYASGNGGLFEGRFECLSEPQLCMPDYPSEAPAFLEEDLTRLGTTFGYLRSFHPGPVGTGPDVVSGSSVEAFAYVSVPVNELMGERAFCADSTRTICFTPAGTVPVVEDGLCRACQALE